MKKTYATPSVIGNGSVVRETMVSGSQKGAESPLTRPNATGSVGFYL